MNYDTIRLDHDNGILWLTLNRPQMLNAFTLQMADELIDAFGRASSDDAVRVVIVTGAGRDIVLGGAGGDTITTGTDSALQGSNIVLGDHGFIRWVNPATGAAAALPQLIRSTDPLNGGGMPEAPVAVR